jgi:hypothetical protein
MAEKEEKEEKEEEEEQQQQERYEHVSAIKCGLTMKRRTMARVKQRVHTHRGN